MPFSPFDSVEFGCDSEAPQQNQQRQHPEQCLEVRCASRAILKASACYRMERGYRIYLLQAEATALLDRRERAPGILWGLPPRLCGHQESGGHCSCKCSCKTKDELSSNTAVLLRPVSRCAMPGKPERCARESCRSCTFWREHVANWSAPYPSAVCALCTLERPRRLSVTSL